MKSRNLLLILLSVIFLLAQADKAVAQGIWTAYTTANSNIPFNKILNIEVDMQNNVWVSNNVSGNYNHALCFDGTNWTGYFPSLWIYDFTVDANGNVWTVHNNALQKFDGSTWTSYSSGLLSFWVFPMHADKQGNIWSFVQSPKSLIKFDGSIFTEITPSLGLPSNNITCFESDSLGLFIGTSDAGLLYYNGTSFTSYTTAGSILPSNNVMAMKMDHDTLWIVCSGNNLVKFVSGSTSIINHSALAGSVEEMAIDDNGNIWMANYGTGIVKYDGNIFTVFNYAGNSILDPFDHYNCIAVDDSNNVWIGTYEAGLIKYEQDGSIVTITEVEQPKPIDVTIYPNPVSHASRLSVILEEESSFTVSIIDTRGLIIESRNYNMPAGEHLLYLINTEELTSGIYLCVVHNEKYIAAKQFLSLR